MLQQRLLCRPALLLMDGTKWDEWFEAGMPNSGPLLAEASSAWASVPDVAIAVGTAVIGITALAAGLAGFFRAPLSLTLRLVMLTAALLLLFPNLYSNITGGVIFFAVTLTNRRFAR